MNFLDNIAKAKILVVGDLMLDRYWWGTVTRISPEAPVPIVHLTRSSLAPGGAANVAVNISGLGATPILIGAIGKDSEADQLRKVLKENEVSDQYLVEIESRPTTVKTRIIAHSQQIARVDSEVVDEIAGDDVSKLEQAICRAIEMADAVVVSDYAKGLLSEGLLSTIIKSCGQVDKKVLVDPKGRNYGKYRGATLVTPNRREAAEACNFDDSHTDVVERAGRKLIDEHQFASVLITRGEEGMTLFLNGSNPVHFKAMAREVYDVTGAGDTVIATLAASIASGAELSEAAKLANIAAGLVVEQIGTTAVKLSDLRSVLDGK
jgi:rfaE bifunctional protein kinase chain/domain